MLWVSIAGLKKKKRHLTSSHWWFWEYGEAVLQDKEERLLKLGYPQLLRKSMEEIPDL